MGVTYSLCLQLEGTCYSYDSPVLLRETSNKIFNQEFKPSEFDVSSKVCVLLEGLSRTLASPIPHAHALEF